MSHALCEMIPIQNLMKEIHCIFMPNPMTDFCITVHEDNLSASAMAKSLKVTPHTKHIAIKYHHFGSKVITSFNLSGDIKIKYISTKNQLADIISKPIDACLIFPSSQYVMWLVKSYQFFFYFQGSMRMQASILSLDFTLRELIFIKAHNSIQLINSINSKA